MCTVSDQGVEDITFLSSLILKFLDLMALKLKIIFPLCTQRIYAVSHIVMLTVIIEAKQTRKICQEAIFGTSNLATMFRKLI